MIVVVSPRGRLEALAEIRQTKYVVNFALDPPYPAYPILVRPTKLPVLELHALDF